MTSGLVRQVRLPYLWTIQRWQQLSQAMERRVHQFDRRRRRRARELAVQRSVIRAWIAEWGLFQTCPVRGYQEVTNSFGVTVRIPHVPVHIHQGDDILSSFGTPIVAPFAGDAVASRSHLGGMAVTVYGDRGYVYNAHLEAYGTLGHVSAGTVIGYVGSTGDARSPHDHFEWHPGNGPAVDPYPYLSVVC
jgi:murein DD-endopeptidase MepM/ murein hydrolase activator NlpD